MKIDLYTKCILTGILGCLLWLCAMHTSVATPVEAQLGPTPVLIAGYTAAGSTQGLDRGLPVRVLAGNETASAPAPPATAPAPVAAASTPPEPAYGAPAQTAMRCQALTKKGTQCSRIAKPGSRYCWQHGG
jgi:hypothetical protein